MLKSLSLRQFKSFRETATVPLAPLTLLYGSNSGGKSTIVQAIMLLKQTLDSTAAPGSPLIFGSDAYLDLGNFQNVVSDHDDTKQLSISVAINNPRSRAIDQANEALREMFDAARLAFVFAASENGTPQLTALEVHIEDSALPLATYKVSTEALTSDQMMRYWPQLSRTRSHSRSPDQICLELAYLDFDSPFMRAAFDQFMESIDEIRGSLSRPEMDAAKFDETELDAFQIKKLSRRFAERNVRRASWQKRLANYDIAAFREDFLAFSNQAILVLNRFLPCLSLEKPSTMGSGPSLNELVAIGGHVPPMIDIAQLVTTIGGRIEDEFEELTYIGPLREFPERNYIFSAGGERTVGLRGENLPGILFSSAGHTSELNRLADLMQLGYEVSVHRSRDPELDNVFAVRLIDQVTKARVGISDVGFGISQVLPILLQCALRRRGCIVMEQPEIHLNPKLQASLAEVFASTVMGGSQQLIIETHSEHLLLRLQKLVRHGTLDADKLSVVYVSKSERGSGLMPIEISSDGERLTPWPDGFFDDTYRELFDAVR